MVNIQFGSCYKQCCKGIKKEVFQFYFYTYDNFFVIIQRFVDTLCGLINYLQYAYLIKVDVISLHRGYELFNIYTCSRCFITIAVFPFWTILIIFFQILDDSLTLSKNGHVLVYIRQTIPVGCYYTDNEKPDCEEEIIFVNDDSRPDDICTGGIRVQNDKNSMESSMKVQVRW